MGTEDMRSIMRLLFRAIKLVNTTFCLVQQVAAVPVVDQLLTFMDDSFQ